MSLFSEDNNTGTKNPYLILEVAKYSTAEEIKRAYRRLALKYHPDRNGNGKETFILVRWAYGILSDPEKKHLYDKFAYIEGEQEDGFDITLSKLNKEMTEDSGELRVKNFQQSLKEDIPQTVCSDCDGLGFKEKAEGFFITRRKCKQCRGTGYVEIIIKQKPDKQGGFFAGLGEYLRDYAQPVNRGGE